MTTYKIELDDGVLKVNFGEPAQNDQIVRDAASRLAEMASKLTGGTLLKINGPISIPVAFVLAHKLAHLYGAIAQLQPLGELYRKDANKIIDALSTRNNSLFAHGFKPISNSDYGRVDDVIVKFIEAGISVVKSPKSNWHP